MSTPRISCGHCGEPVESFDAFVNDHNCPDLAELNDPPNNDDTDPDDGRLIADGGPTVVEFRQLTALQQLLVETAVQRWHERDPGDAYGRAIKRDVEALLGRNLSNYSYSNLNRLVERGYLDKHPLNERSNAFIPTPAAIQATKAEHARLTQIVDAIDDSENTPPDAAPNPVGVER